MTPRPFTKEELLALYLVLPIILLLVLIGKFGWAFAVLSFCEFGLAFRLARGLSEPGPFGDSAAGQFFMAIGTLGLGLAMLEGPPEVENMGLVLVIAMLPGVILEGRAGHRWRRDFRRDR
jgi:hypothetical protein